MGHGERSVKLKDKKYLANQKVLFKIYKKRLKKCCVVRTLTYWPCWRVFEKWATSCPSLSRGRWIGECWYAT